MFFFIVLFLLFCSYFSYVMFTKSPFQWWKARLQCFLPLLILPFSASHSGVPYIYFPVMWPTQKKLGIQAVMLLLLFFFCRLSNSFPSSVSPYGFRLGFVYWNSFRVGNALVIHHVPVLAIPINCMAWVAFVLRCSSCGPWTDSSLFIWQQSMSWLSS